MISERFTVGNRAGFHMRLAGLFTSAMNNFLCTVTIRHKNREVNGKSVMSVMASCIKQGSEIEVLCSGVDEAEALRTAAELIQTEEAEPPLLFVWYPACSTCQKARAWLDGRGLPYQLRDMKLQAPVQAELSAWYQKSGLPLKRFFHTSGLVYKALELSSKLPHMTEAEQLTLLASDGMLVKRPILVGGTTVFVGFQEALWRERITQAT